MWERKASYQSLKQLGAVSFRDDTELMPHGCWGNFFWQGCNLSGKMKVELVEVMVMLKDPTAFLTRCQNLNSHSDSHGPKPIPCSWMLSYFTSFFRSSWKPGIQHPSPQKGLVNLLSQSTGNHPSLTPGIPDLIKIDLEEIRRLFALFIIQVAFDLSDTTFHMPSCFLPLELSCM